MEERDFTFDRSNPRWRWCPYCKRVTHARFRGGHGWMCDACVQRIPAKRDGKAWREARQAAKGQ